MDNYFDTKANKGMFNGREVYDHNEYLRLTGQQGSNNMMPNYGGSNFQSQTEGLNKRYDELLKSLKNREQQAVTKQTTITNNELGKRGIVGSSTLAGQEIQNTTEPIHQQYAGLEAQTELERTRDLNAIQQAIQQSQMQQQQYSDQQKQRAFENALKEKQVNYDINKPYSSGSGGGGIDLSALYQALGAVGGNSQTAKPTPSFKPAFGPLSSGYVFANPNSKFSK